MNIFYWYWIGTKFSVLVVIIQCWKWAMNSRFVNNIPDKSHDQKFKMPQSILNFFITWLAKHIIKDSNIVYFEFDYSLINLFFHACNTMPKMFYPVPKMRDQVPKMCYPVPKEWYPVPKLWHALWDKFAWRHLYLRMWTSVYIVIMRKW